MKKMFLKVWYTFSVILVIAGMVMVIPGAMYGGTNDNPEITGSSTESSITSSTDSSTTSSTQISNNDSATSSTEISADTTIHISATGISLNKASATIVAGASDNLIAAIAP
ncbi:MAG: hypothetical protein ACYCXK_04675, partial [Candidatus Humimicrobiaceae bacterium]